MKLLKEQSLQIQSSPSKWLNEGQAGRSGQGGHLRWGLALGCAGAMLAALLMWTASLNADDRAVQIA